MPVIWGRSVTLIAVELSHFLHCQCCVTEWNRRISWTCWQSEILYLSSRRKHLLWVTQMLVWYLVVIDLLLPWYPFIFSRAELDLDAIGWLAQTVFWPKKIKKKERERKKGPKLFPHPWVFVVLFSPQQQNCIWFLNNELNFALNHLENHMLDLSEIVWMQWYVFRETCQFTIKQLQGTICSK